MIELLQAWEEVIDNFRNIMCLSSYVSQAWKRALSIPCSKLEHKALCSNLFCWQFCDRQIICLAQVFCFKIGEIIASQLTVLLSGSTLDHEYEKLYTVAVWQNQSRCSLALTWGGGWGGRLHRPGHVCCSRARSGPQLCCPLRKSVCSSLTPKCKTFTPVHQLFAKISWGGGVGGGSEARFVEMKEG